MKALVLHRDNKARPGRCFNAHEGELRCFNCVGCAIARLHFMLTHGVVGNRSSRR